VVLFALVFALAVPVEAAPQPGAAKLKAKIQEKVQERVAERAAERAAARAARRAAAIAARRSEAIREAVTVRRVQRRVVERARQRAAARIAQNRAARISALAAEYQRARAERSQRDDTRRGNLQKQLRAEFGLGFARLNNRDVLARWDEVLGINLSPESLNRAEALGFRAKKRRQLRGLGLTVDVLALPKETSLDDALSILKDSDPDGTYELNAVFDRNGEAEVADMPSVDSSVAQEGLAFTVGLIDTGVDPTHAALTHVEIEQQNFGGSRDSVARDHGTAVASIVASLGRPRLKVADVFSSETGLSDATGIVEALNWMSEEKIGVVNMSLSGPDNGLVRFAVELLIDRGHLIVAAVGNEGPDGAPQYPAAYPDVIGVTAVDAQGEVYDRANRGDYVDVAAPGVEISAASLEGIGSYSGTSFATPVVSAYLAPLMATPDHQQAEQAWGRLKGDVQDMGASGPDQTYGYGLLTTLNSTIAKLSN